MRILFRMMAFSGERLSTASDWCSNNGIKPLAWLFWALCVPLWITMMLIGDPGQTKND